MKKIRSKKITVIFTTIVIFVTTIALGNAEKIANETAFVHKSSTVTANQQTLVQAPSNVSKQGTTNDATLIWEDFLHSKTYKNFTKDYEKKAASMIKAQEYVIMDLNADAIPELLIQFKENSGFYYTYLFVLDNKHIQLSYESHGYGSYSYLPSNNIIIVPPNVRPFSKTAYYYFYTLQGTKFKYVFGTSVDKGKFFNNSFADMKGEEKK